MTRDAFIEFVLVNLEGGGKLWDDPAGGPTRFGISQRAYPTINIENVTLELATHIAVRDYWLPCRCDELPPAIAYAVFDFAFNSGVDKAIRSLQAALGVKVDGKIGPVTLAAAHKAGDALVVDYLASRAMFMTGLLGFRTNGRGWMRRLFTLSRAIA